MHEFDCIDTETLIVLLARVNEPVLVSYADGDLTVSLTDEQYQLLTTLYPVYTDAGSV